MSIAKAIKQILPQNAFVRGVIVLGGGTAGSQVILLLTAPLLTRLYSAEDFGLLAVFMAILSSLSAVSSLRYELAIPIAEDEQEAVHIVVLAFLITFGVSLIVFFGVVFFRDSIAITLNVPDLASYLWLLPLSLLLLSSYQIFNYWAIRVKAFSAIARTKLTQSVASIIVKIGGAPFGPLALIFGEVVGQVAGTTSLGTLAIRHRWHSFRVVRSHQIRTTAHRHRKFPMFATWGGLLNTVGTQLPPVLFAALFNPAAAGIYALANRVLSLPMNLVGQAIGNVFLAKAADARRDGTVHLLVAQVHEKLAHIAMPPALVLAIIGPDLFVWVFGAEWREAGVFAQLMVPMLYFQFILSPISTLFSVLDKQGQGMVLQGVMVITRSSTLVIGAWLGDVRLAVTLFAIGSAASYFAFLVWVIKISGNHWLTTIKPTFQTLFIGLLLVSPLMVTSAVTSNVLFLFGAIILTALLIGARYFVLIRSAWT